MKKIKYLGPAELARLTLTEVKKLERERALSDEEKRIVSAQMCSCGYDKVVNTGQALTCPNCGWYQPLVKKEK
jgi:hypothetical protein